MVDAITLKKGVIASLPVIFIGIGLTLLEALLPIVLSVIFSLLDLTEIIGNYVIHLFLALKIIFAVLFFLLFFGAGYRAVRKYGLSIPMAGGVSAFSAGAVAVFSTILALAMQFGLIAIIGSALSGFVDRGEIDTAMLIGAGGLAMVGAGLIATVFFGIVGFFLNILLNFIVGALGGLFSTR